MQSRAEKRRSRRVAIDLVVTFAIRSPGAEAAVGIAKDVSIGGMFIETAAPAPFGAAVLVSFEPSGFVRAVLVPATVRWTRVDGMGVQFGLLGARETHAITEMTRASGVRERPPMRR